MSRDVVETADTLAEPTGAEAAATSGKHPIALGTAIGRFMVLGELGAGGMGTVLSAYDPELDRRVALKSVHAGRGTEAEDRLLREAKAMARLRHDNVLMVHDIVSDRGSIYLAIEFVEGRDLRKELAVRRERGTSWKEIVDLFVAAGRGLAAAHAAGLVHRDFKPDNVLCGSDGRVLVADFGLVGGSAGPAGTGGDPAASHGTLTDSITRGDQVLGTPAYMSPQQHDGAPVDARTDQFAFCVSLWEALYGELPFPAHTLAEYLSAMADHELRPPPEGKAPPWVAKVLARGLRAAPEERYPTMDELLEEFAPADPHFGSRPRAIAVVIVLLTVVGVALVGRRALTYGSLYTLGVAALALIAGAGVFLRESLARHSNNRRRFLLLVLMTLGGLLTIGVGQLAGATALQSAIQALVLFSASVTVFAVAAAEPRLFVMTAGYASAAVISALWTDSHVIATTAAHGVAALTLLLDSRR